MVVMAECFTVQTDNNPSPTDNGPCDKGSSVPSPDPPSPLLDQHLALMSQQTLPTDIT